MLGIAIHSSRRPRAGAGLLLVLLIAASSAAAVPQWTNVTGDAGIAFRNAGEIHVDDIQSPWPAFPEIMGSGACFADFDGDGYEDLYLTKQHFNDLNEAWGPWADEEDVRNKLYINAGDGTFEDRTEDSGTGSEAFSYGCSAADYDGDRDVDLFVANFGPSQLFQNQGGAVFVEVSDAALGEAASPDKCLDYECMSTSSAWGDYDADGDLDLYVANYVETTMTDRFRGPGGHIGQKNFLLRNNGDGTFTDVAEALDVTGCYCDSGGSKSLGAGWFDADLDGDQDLYVNNDEEINYYYENQGGTFTERAHAAGVADHRASMGLAIGDYDNDGWPDLFMTHYQGELHGFYRNNQDGTWEERSGEDDHNQTARVGWGTAFWDFDRDMDLDILTANGHTEWAIGELYPQRMQVFRNDPPAEGADPWDRTWVEVSDDSGPGIGEVYVHRGTAYGDYDYDGDLDIVAANNGNATAQVLAGSGVTQHWLYVKLNQSGMNPSGVGARVHVDVGGVSQWREVQAGSSYLSQSVLTLEFGLGSHTTADTVHVAWPGGGATTLTDVPADRVVRVDRAAGTFTTDTLSPRTKAHLAGTGQGGWFRTAVQAALEAQDLAVGPPSGVAATEVAVGSAAWAPYAGPLTFTEEGVHELHARSVDASANQEPRRTTPVRIDTTLPAPLHALEGPAGSGGWWRGDVTVTLGMTDALSGPGAVTYRLDGGAWQDYVEPFVLSGDGLHELEYVAEDVAGNAAAAVVVEVAIDATAPAVAHTDPAAGSLHVLGEAPVTLRSGPAVLVSGGEAFAVEAEATDATSGVARVVFRLDGAVMATDAEAPYAWSWDTAASASGLHLLEAQAFDAAGNDRTDAVDVLLVAEPLPVEARAGGAPWWAWLGQAVHDLVAALVARPA